MVGVIDSERARTFATPDVRRFPRASGRTTWPSGRGLASLGDEGVQTGRAPLSTAGPSHAGSNRVWAWGWGGCSCVALPSASIEEARVVGSRACAVALIHTTTVPMIATPKLGAVPKYPTSCSGEAIES